MVLELRVCELTAFYSLGFQSCGDMSSWSELWVLKFRVLEIGVLEHRVSEFTGALMGCGSD